MTADFKAEDGLVCTVGWLSIWPGASNVIAGSANFTVRSTLLYTSLLLLQYSRGLQHTCGTKKWCVALDESNPGVIASYRDCNISYFAEKYGLKKILLITDAGCFEIFRPL